MTSDAVVLEPVVGWPREMELGRSYLVTVDIRSADLEAWPYDEEQFELSCVLDAPPYLDTHAVDDPVLVLHRFGGTYRPVRFVVSARQLPPDYGPTELWLSYVNRWGVLLRTVPLALTISPRRGAMPGNQLSSIQHIVHLMLENRSFDHMLGFLYADSGNVSPAGDAFEGLTGQESNPGPKGAAVSVFRINPSDRGAYFMPGADPGNGYANTNSQLFGSGKPPNPPTATNPGFVTNFADAITYDQRSGRSVQTGTTASDIMGMFPPAALPVLSGLAKGFAVCDHWYSSVPTETFPNRAFACAATSQGHMNDGTASFTVPTIFGLMTAHSLTWKIYGYNEEPLTRKNFPDTLSAPDSCFGLFAGFQSDAAAGTLPQYSFLEPSWGSTGNSQHPNYDVSLGEKLIQDVYNAVRNGPGWNQTLLFITYDEHGGLYDHVPPPSGATPPDATPGEFGFDFKRFGVRVPAVLVSPLIPAGTVFRVPGPTPLDHTSVLKTIQTRWGLPALTARDAAAPDVGDVLSLAAPRTDDPLAGVTAPTSTGTNPAAAEVSHLQLANAQLTSELQVPLSELRSAPLLANQHTPADYDHYIGARTATWKAAKASGNAPPG